MWHRVARGCARSADGGRAPVTAHDTHAEYKQVTVLFADVVHSMDIAATVGAERLREIMTDLADRCAAVVKRYGGTVDKFTGDGIMAVFGAPVALEDHAVRACRAALGIQDATVRLAAEVKDRDGIDLRLRVGLNSGQVIAGEAALTSLGYTTIGEQVGMAQRMESVAPPGGAIVSASTARLVEGAANSATQSCSTSKELTEPVAAQRLLGIGNGFAPPRLLNRIWWVGAGRCPPSKACWSAPSRATARWSAWWAPRARKSRRVREVAAMAAARGVEVFSAFCESHASDIPFGVVARLLRVAFRVADLDAPAARTQIRARGARCRAGGPVALR